MADLTTSYMGLKLRSPLIAASSGLTNNLKNLEELDHQGIGAIVLKSLFEEQIRHEAHSVLNHQEFPGYPEAYDYVKNYTEINAVDKYLNLIREAKNRISVPLIASINCVSAGSWTSFATQLQDAGADALELNIFILPSDPFRSGEENEKLYFDIIGDVLNKVNIPVSVKLSWYFSGLAKTLTQMSWTGIKGMVLFNRFYSPDIDLDDLDVTPAFVFSDPAEMHLPLRWIAMLSDKLHCDLVGSTGVHNGESALKLLLAGAKAVQIASVLYKYGLSRVSSMNEEINDWLDKQGFKSLNEIIGKLSYHRAENPAAYERMQFMRYYSGIE
ncbi:MAG: dihydroorotate dehydrogenase-like protein [Bacteroidales bacterium]